MDDTNALTYARQTLIDSLTEQLKEREDKRAADLQAQKDRNQVALDQLVELAAEMPQFLVWVVGDLKDHWDATIGTDEFAAAVRRSYGTTSATVDPDEKIKRLIRVYDKAVDETVKVTVNDEVYNYL